MGTMDQDEFAAALREAASHADTSTFRGLLAGCADVNARTKGGKTLLMHVAELPTCNEACLRLLLDAGADVEAADDEGWTALMLAAGAGSETCLKLLLEKGCAVDARDTDGHTALFHAARNDGEYAVSLLLAAGADVSALDRDGFGVLACACEYRAGSGVIRLLLGAGADVGHPQAFMLLAGSVATHNLEYLRLLLAAGAAVDSCTKFGATPLMVAAEHNCCSAAKLLLAAGADVNARDKAGRTALSLAARKGYRDVCDLLLSAGAEMELDILREGEV